MERYPLIYGLINSLSMKLKDFDYLSLEFYFNVSYLKDKIYLYAKHLSNSE